MSSEIDRAQVEPGLWVKVQNGFGQVQWIGTPCSEELHAIAYAEETADDMMLSQHINEHYKAVAIVNGMPKWMTIVCSRNCSKRERHMLEAESTN